MTALKSKYTGRHPDIVNAEKYVADLEEKVQKMKAQDMAGKFIETARETSMMWMSLA